MANSCAVCGLALRKGEPVGAVDCYLVHRACAPQPREIWKVHLDEGRAQRLERELADLRRQLVRAQSDAVDLGRRVERLADERDRLQRRLDKAVAANRDLNAHAEAMERALDVERAALAGAGAELAQLKREPRTPGSSPSQGAITVATEQEDDAASVRYSLLELDLEDSTGG